MYFTVYKTLNIINNEYYIGVHKTDNPYDSYLGSGYRIVNSINKYGVENFKKEILFIYDNEKDMYEKEKELVQEEILKDKKCLNLKVGGFGGFSYINNNNIKKFHSKKHTDKTKKILREKALNKKHTKEIKEKIKEIENKRKLEEVDYYEKKRKAGKCRWKNYEKKPVVECKSRKGRVWVNNGKDSKMFHVEDIPEGWIRGRI